MGRKSNASTRREQIIWALYDCLVDRGSEKVTIKKIAATAGLPAGVIHYYFKSKNEIVSSLALAMVEKYAASSRMLLKNAASSQERIEQAVDFILDALIFNPKLNRVFYNLIQMAFERPALGEVMKQMFANYRTRFARILHEAGAGEDSPVLGATLVAMAEGFSIQLLVDPEALSRKEVRGVILGMIRERLALHGHGAQPARMDPEGA